MGLRSKTILSMDFGTRSIKMVEGSCKKGDLNIKARYFLDLPNGVYEDGYIRDINSLEEIMDSFLRLNNIKRGDVTAVINSSDILTRDIILPSVTSDEIEGIIQYKINDYIPIDLERYAVQYIYQGSFMEGGNEKIKLFIIAMPKELIVTHFNLLKDLDLRPKVLDFQSNAVRKLLLFNEIKNKALSIDNTIASIDIGFSSTKLIIFKDKNIEISRIIPLGIKNILENINLNVDLTEKEALDNLLNLENINEDMYELSLALKSFLIKLSEGLDMVFRYYNSLELSNKIELILLQGSIVKIKDIQNQFEKYLNIKTLSINSLKGNIDKDLHLYSNAIGALLRGEVL